MVIKYPKILEEKKQHYLVRFNYKIYSVILSLIKYMICPFLWLIKFSNK